MDLVQKNRLSYATMSPALSSLYSTCLIFSLYGCHLTTAKNGNNPAKASVASMEQLFIPPSVLQNIGLTKFTIIQHGVTWNDAVKICKERFKDKHGTLARPTSTEAMKKILAELQPGDKVWFGLHWTSTNTLGWSDVSCSGFYDGLFSPFGQGQDDPSTDEKCYYIDADNGDWIRDGCQESHYFVCEHRDATETCSGKNNVKFDYTTISAQFYTESVSSANEVQCTRACSQTTGCFLTWGANKLCLLGVVSNNAKAYVLRRCYDANTERTYSGQVATTNSKEPSSCVPGDATGTSPNGLDLDAVPVVSDHGCTGTTETETVTSTSTLPAQTSTVVQSCTNTVTVRSIYPTTVTISASPIATTIMKTLSLDCSSSKGLSSSQCPDAQTVTEQKTDHVTATVTDCSMTSSCLTVTTSNYNLQPSITPNMPIDGGGIVTTMTVTDSNCRAGISTVTTTATTTEIRTQSHTPLLKTTTTMTLKEVIVPTTVYSLRTDCQNGVTNVLTKTLTTTELSTCDVTPTAVAPTTIVSTVYDVKTVSVTEVVTETPGNMAMLQSCQPQAPSHTIPSRNISSTISPQQLDDLSSAIAKRLIIPPSELSKTRRAKESAADPRISAKVSGIVAIMFISCVFICVVVMDTPVLIEHLKSRIHSLKVTS